MELKDYIGKVVISTKSKSKFYLKNIASPKIGVVTITPDSNGCYTYYQWATVNGDPFSNGVLVFEDENLQEPFKKAYKDFCRTEAAYWEEYGYWMRKD